MQYTYHFQSESPSESDLNALGIYLVVCLAFVICALVEFAIAIVLHRRKESKDVSDVEAESSNNEKQNELALIPQIMKENYLDTKRNSDAVTSTVVARNEMDNRWVTELVTNLYNVPSSNNIDFVAIWIYLVMFLVFNCIYWSDK